ncbi:uncharacterized protein LOC133420388 [Cololabis saira]|uniref:uncharacterized protein LOC133420388 n=1 Tax=Cololabis saira TaxID=129043 RepID=UPI002AD36966|nr:uncharacterized protein LOC133420388 [Cololabis saira]
MSARARTAVARLSRARGGPGPNPDRVYSCSAGTKPVRIGCASGFWGDTAASVPQLVYGGKLDFLVFDYLSEITMSLLTAAKSKAPNMGYAPDFVQLALAPFINDIHKKGIRVVSNAGGVNPLACAEAIREVVKKAGLDLKVAVVTGDDLVPHRSSLSEVKMADGEGKQPLPKTLHSMNAYLGAEPIRRCLDGGADVVVTGRCVDSAVALGPLMHSFGWTRRDYDLLAAGSLAGHLIECGAQSTGGIFTDWDKVPDWDNMGFPVVECSGDGSFVLSKPPKTGGLVSFGTVAEQLVYEIGDPRRYLLPDVICDFSQVEIQEVPGVDGGAVRVTGAKGLPPSHDYKVCATYMDGFRATAVCPVGGAQSGGEGQTDGGEHHQEDETHVRAAGIGRLQLRQRAGPRRGRHVRIQRPQQGLQGGRDLDGRPSQAEESSGVLRQGNRSCRNRHGSGSHRHRGRTPPSVPRPQALLLPAPQVGAEGGHSHRWGAGRLLRRRGTRHTWRGRSRSHFSPGRS